MKIARSMLLILGCIAYLSGCASYKSVTHAGTATGNASLDEQVAPGDRLRVLLRDGTVVNLDVISIDNEEIVGDGATIGLSDIETVERRETNVLGTTLLVGAVVLLLGAYQTADSLEDGIDDLFRGD